MIIGNGPLGRPEFPEENQTYYDQVNDCYCIYMKGTWVECDTHGNPIVSTINICEPETTPTTPSKGTSKRKSKKSEDIN